MRLVTGPRSSSHNLNRERTREAQQHASHRREENSEGGLAHLYSVKDVVVRVPPLRAHGVGVAVAQGEGVARDGARVAAWNGGG